jgi:hypothetical protein
MMHVCVLASIYCYGDQTVIAKKEIVIGLRVDYSFVFVHPYDYGYSIEIERSRRIGGNWAIVVVDVLRYLM